MTLKGKAIIVIMKLQKSIDIVHTYCMSVKANVSKNATW